MANRVFVIGLDSVPPKLVFELWQDILPNLSHLKNEGIWGALLSTDPPITVPAWTCMFSSRDPGEHGIYGFRNRKDYSYDKLAYANSTYIKLPMLWHLCARAQKTSILVGVPQTYPPKPIKGLLIGDFLTPDPNANYTYPPELKDEINKAADGEYIIDVKDFRTDNKSWLLESIYLMTRRRFKVIRHLATKYPWDVFIFVEMGPDRIQHGFWRFFDKSHRLYEKNNEYENAIRDYYIELDRLIGELLELVDADDTIIVVSDHGAKGMRGAIAINQWLIDNGYMKLKKMPTEPSKLSYEDIDWEKTWAWSEGGYYARVFLNVEGREPNGRVPKADYKKFREKLAKEIADIPDENGNSIGTKVLFPEQIYRAVNNIPPDMIIYFGDLDWRSAGTIGLKSIHLFENDTGPDDANHDYEGILIIKSPLIPEEKRGQKISGASLYDITPTILKALDIKTTEPFFGKSLI